MESTSEPARNESSTSSNTTHENAATSDAEQLGEDVDDNCFLCDKPTEPSKSVVLKERGIANLIQASIKRKDKKDVLLKKHTKITVHKSCQISYIRESNIKKALKSAKENWHNCRRRNQNARDFDFSTNCLFCSNIICPWKQDCHRVAKQCTIDKILAQLRVYEASEENKAIAARLVRLKDQDDSYYEENNVSYHAKCLRKFYNYSTTNVQGRPVSENMSDLLSFVINYILENSEDSQFSLQSIFDIYESKHGQVDFPRFERMEQMLKDHFHDEIVLYPRKNPRDTIICYKQTLGHCIESSWYSDRKTNEREEKLRITQLAAHLILQDIRSMKFDTDSDDSPTDNVNNAAEEIPETLKLLLDILIKTHKDVPENGSWSKWDNRITTASQILMSSARPRTFSSSINIDEDSERPPKKRKIVQ